MRHNQETRFTFRNTGRDFMSAPQQQIRHQRMISDRFAIFPDLTARPFRRPAIQLKLARDHCLREVTFANKIRDYVHLADCFRIEQKNCIAQTRLLFPKGTLNICKNFSTPNLGRMRQRRRARVRIHRRAVSYDEKRGI